MKINLSKIAGIIIDSAFESAKKQAHEFVTPEHLLFEALANDEVLDILIFCNANIETLFYELKEYLDKSVPNQKLDKMPSQSIGFQAVIARAIMQCEASERDILDIGDILVSLYDEDSNHAAFVMNEAGIQRLKLIQAVTNARAKKPVKSNLIIDFEKKSTKLPDESSSKFDSFEKMMENSDIEEPKKSSSMLSSYTTNLTELAKQNKMSKVIGRDEEIDATIRVLCRKKKNNPVHIGEPGVGKTAITEGLAQRIVAKDVPDFLSDFEIFSLDMSSLLAGTKFRGDFEERVKGVCKELVDHKKAILFIDEIHSLIGAGTGNNGGYDAANIIKPFLTNGNLRCIGATTYEEYNKAFLKDKALARRFHKIEIKEPTEEQTFKILKGIQKEYEEFHKVHYSDKALKNAVHLSNLYINDRFLPDKAIDVIDEAGSRIRIANVKKANKKVPVIGEKEIDLVVSKIANIPEQKVSTDETEKLKHFHALLSGKIFGQESAVTAVTTAIKRSRAGLRAKNKPVANFLFVGPTGVGKTELAKSIADELGIAMHRFDMSEYQEKHTVSRLIGSPPGYVGFEEGGLLTDAIRRTPHAVLLLDEIEKAHPSIFNILLQIMDYATLTDNQGRKADFRNIILILTSNAGATSIGKPMIGFGGKTFSDTAIDSAVENIFTPEFRNRLDAIVKFSPLNSVAIKKIVIAEIAKLNSMLAEKNKKIEYTDELVEYFAEKGYSQEFGARNIARLIENELVTPLVDLILFQNEKNTKTIKCSVDSKGGIKIATEATELEMA